MAGLLRQQKTIVVAAFLFSSCATVTASPAAPQGPSMMGGWHYRGAYGQMYFTGKDVTLQGTVVETNEFVPRPRMMRGRQIILQTTDGKINVHLGPEWYVREQDFKLKTGERAEIRGKLIGEGAAAFVVASQVSQGGQTWVLRDSEGIPFWCAMRGSMPPTEATPKPVK
ncbi:MAG: hypothetical protein RLZZ488_936 [Pseudomonadota bacterium]|jgi:hypothetical protein